MDEMHSDIHIHSHSQTNRAHAHELIVRIHAQLCPQIIECRRVLSWTYNYGYYALDDMHDNIHIHTQ